METTMTFNIFSVAADAQERMLFHSIFNEWVMAHASEDDWLQLEQACERFAPNHVVCSAVRLVRDCLARQELAQELPQSLRQLLQERNWPQFCDGVTAP